MMMIIAASRMWAGVAEKPEQSEKTLENQQIDSKYIKIGIRYFVPSGTFSRTKNLNVHQTIELHAVITFTGLCTRLPA